VRDQEYCGSCWAFAVIASFSVRQCIKNNYANNFSQQYLVSCDRRNGACDGGSMHSAWEFLQQVGTTSEDCTPYVSGDGYVPSCSNYCSSNSSRFTLTRAEGRIQVLRQGDIQGFKREIMNYGPINAGMQVYEDLHAYYRGIYIRSTDEKSEMHAVTIVGWGYDQMRGDYWIIQNSWGNRWGENGYFKMPVQSCEILDMGLAGDV